MKGRSEIKCPEFTKRMEYLLRFVIEGQYGQSSLASELAASTNGRYISSGWYVEMLTVGITQLGGDEGKREDGERSYNICKYFCWNTSCVPHS